MYLLFSREDGAAVNGDAEGDAASGGGAKSSMSGGRRARSSWQRIRWGIVPPVLDGRRLVVQVGSSHAKSTSQKPYS